MTVESNIYRVFNEGLTFVLRIELIACQPDKLQVNSESTIGNNSTRNTTDNTTDNSKHKSVLHC